MKYIPYVLMALTMFGCAGYSGGGRWDLSALNNYNNQVQEERMENLRGFNRGKGGEQNQRCRLIPKVDYNGKVYYDQLCE